MISQLRGTILDKQPPQLVLNVNGIGYEIDAPMSTFYRLPDVGAEFTLLIHFIVREDGHFLYGFATSEEKTLFRTLLKVNGVGPRLALTILSSIEPHQFFKLVSDRDTDSLVKLPGVGKKTAERLIIEMRDKVAALEKTSTLSINEYSPVRNRNQNVDDAVAALIALGYKPQEASKTVSKIDDGSKTSEDMIRQALREMMT